ncbi:MAG: hypothetical protein K2K30_07580 [Alistipes sp.]|nr:hypothetical protein [Alistipes sp.]
MIMKIPALIASLMLSLAIRAQPATPVFRIGADGSIATDPPLIDPFYNDPRIKNLTCVLNGSTSITLGSQSYDIRTGYFEEDWFETERGRDGFTVIAIYSDNRKIFELRQPEIWAHTYAGRPTWDYRPYTDNRYFIPIALSEQAVALAFVGWPYGGEMPYLTIIALTDHDAKLVFNKHMGINEITRSDESFSMEIQANIVEFGEDGKPFDTPGNVPIIHRLETKDGLLYFK